MERYKIDFTVSGKPAEHTLTRMHQSDCTMIGGRISQNIDRTRMFDNYIIYKRCEIRHNLPSGEGGRKPEKDFRFVDGEKIVFGEIFGETCEIYNRRQKRKDRQKTSDTYYDKCRKRWQKTYDTWNALPKGEAKDKAYKKIFNYSKEITIRIGSDSKKCPTKMQMDEFGRKFFEWFRGRFPQMVTFIAVVLYDEMVQKTENKEKKWVNLAPSLHIGFIPVAYNQDGKAMDKVVAWNRCLAQSMKGSEQDYKGFAFSGFRREVLQACARIAKDVGFGIEFVSCDDNLEG